MGEISEEPGVELHFKRRSRGSRSRKRPRSPSDEKRPESGKAGEGQTSLEAGRSGGSDENGARLSLSRASVRPKVARGRDVSWKVEYGVADGHSGTHDRAQHLATAGRHEIDEADDGKLFQEKRQEVEGSREARSKSSDADKQAKKAFGPLRAPTHIRTSVVTDMQPDVCKDYKETGYCGFGDSCKFLHDRGDYKAGWQLDKEWAEKEEEKRQAIARGEDPDAPREKVSTSIDDDGLPFACFICRKPFKDPVVTLCDHHFCEVCAVNRMATDSTCAVCSKQLRGVLNTSHRLIAKANQTQVI